LDTWFSSALWPFATLGWPHATPELRAFYPTDVLVTARDILFLWVARMVMMGLRFPGDVPFTDVYVHSVIQAPDGRRMSKSLGTGIDPLDLIDGGPRPPVFQQGGTFPSYGADAVRFGLLAMSSTQDVRFSEEKIHQGAQLANKLWNASRFVLLRVGEGVEAAPRPQTVEDRWILSRLQRAKRAMRRALDAFEFHHAALGLYDFVFGELCDRYIELVKPRLGEPDVQATLLLVLRETLALAHPVIPFVTEEIWSHVPDAEGLLVGSRWPGSGGPRASWPTRASSSRRPSASCRPRATSSSRCGASSPSSTARPDDRRRTAPGGSLDRGRRRALPPRPRAVRHALRPGSHAPPADDARLAAGAVRVDPCRRHERQELDGAHDRRDPGAPRAAHRRVSLAASR